LTPDLHIRPEVATALDAGRAVVALESTVISHGLPHPHNLEIARQLEAVIRDGGATPATVAILGGRICVGLDDTEIEHLATASAVAKVSRRDLGAVLARGGDGATTVAATMIAAALAGIRVFATGGIGGVHRGGEMSLDVSADLTELGRSPVAVVASGAKAILDLPRTLEVLETHGVPVIGYGTDRFPAFFSRDSGLALDARAETPSAAAAIMAAHWDLGLSGGLLLCNPVPETAALAREQVAAWVDVALGEAEAAAIAGAEVTPFLLDRLTHLSAGHTLAANIALLENNAAVAAEIALAYGKLIRGRG
jgi:pseudouridine-5'-phosphate glycosidase